MRISESVHDCVLLPTDLGRSGPIGILVEREDEMHEIATSSNMFCTIE